MFYSRQKTFLAAEALVAGDILFLNDDAKAAKMDLTAGNLKRFIGVAATNAASGAEVAPKVGLVSLTVGAAVKPGQKIVCSSTAAQKVVAFDAVTMDADRVIGIAMSNGAADGDLISAYVF